MRLSGKELLRTLNDYFSQTNVETEIIFMLLIPALITILVLIFFSRESTGEHDPFSVISNKDMDFIETVRLEKALETFDRDFLLSLALNFKIKPAYQVFIDKLVFESLVNNLRSELKDNQEDPDKNSKLLHLLSLQKKLFKL